MSRRTFLASLAALPWAAAASAIEEAPRLHVFGRLPAPERVKRVFAAGGPAAVLAHVLAPGALLGWPMELSDETRAFLPPEVRDRPHLGRLSGRGSTMPLEKLMALEPDLVLDAGQIDATYLSAAESLNARTGLPCVVVPGRLLDSPWQLRETGRLLGVPERGELLAADAGSRLAAGKAVRERTGRKAFRSYLARGADGLETALAGSVNAESLELAGGVNVAALPGGGVARVSLEQILAWSPEVVVTQEAAFHARASADPLWRRLPALREGRFHLVPRLPFGWIDGPPGVNRLIGVSWLASRLDGKPGGDDVVGKAQAFHRLYYGHDPGRRAFERLLVKA